ncbi:hypothetical protein NESM_000294600 [Novymonas esmeraldas]|uniref:Uncharacterized protein n=1 Tax=Novymonas esmeraldas TaxID=1808958 RepID=A0AAW0F8K6_9TRYP
MNSEITAVGTDAEGQRDVPRSTSVTAAEAPTTLSASDDHTGRSLSQLMSSARVASAAVAVLRVTPGVTPRPEDDPAALPSCTPLPASLSRARALPQRLSLSVLTTSAAPTGASTSSLQLPRRVTTTITATDAAVATATATASSSEALPSRRVGGGVLMSCTNGAVEAAACHSESIEFSLASNGFTSGTESGEAVARRSWDTFASTPLRPCPATVGLQLQPPPTPAELPSEYLLSPAVPPNVSAASAPTAPQLLTRGSLAPPSPASGSRSSLTASLPCLMEWCLAPVDGERGCTAGAVGAAELVCICSSNAPAPRPLLWPAGHVGGAPWMRSLLPAGFTCVTQPRLHAEPLWLIAPASAASAEPHPLTPRDGVVAEQRPGEAVADVVAALEFALLATASAELWY